MITMFEVTGPENVQSSFCRQEQKRSFLYVRDYTVRAKTNERFMPQCCLFSSTRWHSNYIVSTVFIYYVYPISLTNEPNLSPGTRKFHFVSSSSCRELGKVSNSKRKLNSGRWAFIVSGYLSWSFSSLMSSDIYLSNHLLCSRATNRL